MSAETVVMEVQQQPKIYRIDEIDNIVDELCKPFIGDLRLPTSDDLKQAHGRIILCCGFDSFIDMRSGVTAASVLNDNTRKKLLELAEKGCELFFVTTLKESKKQDVDIMLENFGFTAANCKVFFTNGYQNKGNFMKENHPLRGAVMIVIDCDVKLRSYVGKDAFKQNRVRLVKAFD